MADTHVGEEMIETREQYERLRANAQHWSGDFEDAVETIEALSEVAIAAAAVIEAKNHWEQERNISLLEDQLVILVNKAEWLLEE